MNIYIIISTFSFPDFLQSDSLLWLGLAKQQSQSLYYDSLTVFLPLCGDYFLAAKIARQEIQHIRDGETTLHDVLETAVELSNSPDETMSKGLRKLKRRRFLMKSQ